MAANPDALGEQLFLLAEGAMVTAGIEQRAEPAEHAGEAARLLIDAHRQDGRPRRAPASADLAQESDRPDLSPPTP